MAKVIEAKVTKPKLKPKKRMSKGAVGPWTVWAINKSDGFYEEYNHFTEIKEAEDYIFQNPNLLCPRIVHIHIPKMEY